MWLFVPAVKQGRTKKLASLWRGPYTVIDRINGALNYRIQLVGSTKTVVVHRNRLKQCYGLPKEGKGQNRRANPVPKQTNEASRLTKLQGNEDYVVHEESGCYVMQMMSLTQTTCKWHVPREIEDPLIVMGFMLNTKIWQGCKKLGREYCNNVYVAPAHEMPA